MQDIAEKTDLAGRLDDPALLRGDAYLAGDWAGADGGATFNVTNPARGDVLMQVADLGRAEVARAIDAAHAAQKGWARRTAEDRGAVLMAWHDEMVRHADDLAVILTAEQGKPLSEARGEVMYGAGFIKWFAEEARRVRGEIIPGHAPDKRIHVLRQPVGVAAAITPWNFPNAMITRKAGPALAAGCAFVVRPPTLTPLSALALGELATRAGLPEGIFSVLPSSDASAIGKEFCENDKVRKLTFTGSTEVGRILLKQASGRVLKASMELGGNAPFLVFDDADLDDAVEGAIACKFRNAGQTCVCANRIYVQSGIYDAFAEKLKEKLSQMRVGDALAGEVDFGPLIDEDAVKKVEEHIADARDKGGDVIYGGSRHEKGGTFFEPTIVTGATQEMAFATEETFGPLAPLFRFETEEEAVSHANDTIFGLASYFFSNDLSRVTRVSEALDYGIVGVNTGLISTPVAPFGGMKQSGLGREGSHLGIEDYIEVKYVCLGVKL